MLVTDDIGHHESVTLQLTTPEKPSTSTVSSEQKIKECQGMQTQNTERKRHTQGDTAFRYKHTHAQREREREREREKERQRKRENTCRDRQMPTNIYAPTSNICFYSLDLKIFLRNLKTYTYIYIQVDMIQRDSLEKSP